MKKCVILVFLLLLLLSVVVCSSAEQKHFKGYGIETWTDGDKLTIKTDNCEFSVKILPKELSLEQEFALETWRDILSVHVSEENEHLEKIKAIKVKEIIRHIEILAARLKTGKMDFEFEDVSIEAKDIKKALVLLNQTSLIVADRFVGNWDDHCSVPELNKLINWPETSFQVGVVVEMIRSYHPY